MLETDEGKSIVHGFDARIVGARERRDLAKARYVRAGGYPTRTRFDWSSSRGSTPPRSGR